MSRLFSKPRATALGLSALLLATFSLTGKHAVLAAPLAPVTHFAAQNDALDFDIVNKTGYDLKKVLIARSVEPEWDDDDDVLKGRTFENGTKLHISFSPKAHSAKWDLKVVYAIDGSSHEWTNLNLANINTITLRYNKDTDTTKADIE